MTKATILVAAAVLGGLLAACSSSGHHAASTSRPVPTPSSTQDQLVVKVVQPGRPAATAGVRVTAHDQHRRAIVATTDPSGTVTFHLPRGTYTVSAGCGGARVVTARGKVVLPLRVQCPPP